MRAALPGPAGGDHVLRGRFRVAIVTLLGLVGVLALAEVGASLVLPSSGDVPPDLFVADATRGLALRPGFHGTVTRAGHSFDVSIDAAGYRDDPLPAGPTPRLLVVGSSAGFGVGLSRDASLVGQIARDLATRYAVMNASVYTYGPLQSLATLRRECPGVHPALVLYLHEYKNTRSDFLALRNAASDAGTEAEAPTTRPTASLVALRSLLSNNDLHPRQIVERLIGLDRLPIDYRNRYVTTVGPAFSPENARRAAAMIGDMATAAQRCGADFRMAVLPGPNEAYYGIAEPATEALLAALRTAGQGDLVIDTRAGIKRGSVFFLSGIDYPNTAGAAYLGARIAAQLPALGTKAGE
jgi:hypothetical protein